MAHRRCLLHIGICKTGTTSVQHVLAANRTLLLQYGYYIPRTFGPTHNHRHLPLLAVDATCEEGRREWRVMQRRLPGLDCCSDLEMAKLLVEQDLRAELAGCPPEAWVVFSSEQLSQRLSREADLWRLRGVLERLGFEEMRILVYLREQVGLALSWESMEALAGKPNPVGLEPSEQFDHRLLLQRWERVFGRNAIQARTYARKCLCGGDIVQDVLECGLGLPQQLPLLQLAQWRNGRLGVRSLRLLQWLNRSLAADTPQPVADVWRMRLVRWSSPLWIGGRPRRASPELVARFSARYAASNRWVDDRYGTRLGDTFAAT